MRKLNRIWTAILLWDAGFTVFDILYLHGVLTWVFSTVEIVGGAYAGIRLAQSRRREPDAEFVLPDGLTSDDKRWLATHGMEFPDDCAAIDVAMNVIRALGDTVIDVTITDEDMRYYL